MSAKELQMLREYLNIYLKNSFIRFSRLSAALPVLFVFKANGGLRLCVDYKGLNIITIKNRYPLLLIKKIFDRVTGAKVFTKFDIKIIYYRVRIRESDK